MRAIIVKTSAMGDVAQALRVAEYLKVQQNVQTVGWVVEEPMEALVKSYPYVDVVLPINSKKIRASVSPTTCVSEWCRQRGGLSHGEPWDVSFDLQGNAKSMLINMCLKAEKKVGYGWKSAPEKVNVFSTTMRLNPPHDLSMRNEYLWLVQSYFEDHDPYVPSESKPLRLTQEQERLVSCELKRWPLLGEKPVWVISSGSRWINKTCRASTMLEILEKAYRDVGGIFFVFVAGSYDELKEVGYFASRFLSSSVVLFQPELPVLSHLIMHADRVLAMDSLVLHLAALTDTPTFSFFGPSSSLKYAPMRELDGVFQGNCPIGSTFVKRCHILRSCATGACLRDASADSIAASLLKWNRRVTELVRGYQNRHTALRGQLPVGSSPHPLSVSSQ